MFEQPFKNIDDVLWKEAGCITELDYTEQTSWLLFPYLHGFTQKATGPNTIEYKIGQIFGEIKNKIHQRPTQRLANLYERKLAALDELKKSLLHQVFTGQLSGQSTHKESPCKPKICRSQS